MSTDSTNNSADVYQGHLNDGSSIQKHSAGGMYPCVLFVRYGMYGIITPDDQAGTLYESYDAAIEAGMKWKATH